MRIDPKKFMLIPLRELATQADLASSYHAFMQALEQRSETHPEEQNYPARFEQWPTATLAERFNDYVHHQTCSPHYLPLVLVDVEKRVVVAETLLRSVPNTRPPVASPVTVVHPDHRNNGIGKVILLQTITAAQQAGFAGLLMESREDNPASWRSIEKLVAAGMATRLADSGSGEHVFKNYHINTSAGGVFLTHALLPQAGGAVPEAPQY